MPPLDDSPTPITAFRHGPEPRHPPTGSFGAMDWDDVRVFLAVARHGSLRAAGRALALSQPTIGRRLAAFEAAFGGPTLFDGCPRGCASTPPAPRWSALPRNSKARAWPSNGGAPRHHRG